MKLLFEKYDGRERLNSWTRIFNNIDEVINFLQETKDKHFSLTGDYSIVISQIKE